MTLTTKSPLYYVPLENPGSLAAGLNAQPAAGKNRVKEYTFFSLSARQK